MLKKAKVVNIQFQQVFKNNLQTRSSQMSQGIFTQPDLNLQTFMRSSSTTTQTYQLINIIKNPPINLTQLFKQNNQNISFLGNQQNINYNCYQMTPILPNQRILNTTQIFYQSNRQQNQQNQLQNQLNQQQKLSNHSIDIQISKANSTFIPQQINKDQINQQKNQINQKNTLHIKSNFINPFQNLALNDNKQQIEPDEYFYLIPQKYCNNLYLILTHFLNYKMLCVPGKQNLKTPNINKRPKTTSKNINNFKIKQIYQMTDSKPFTAISQNRKQNCKNSYPQVNITDDFNDHLQKLMQMEKQIEKKSKKIIFLENQLQASTQTIKQKNIEIKQMQQKQAIIKKKFKYQIDRIMKGKVMTDINDIFLSNLQEQNKSGKSIFQINGKTYVKSDQAKSIYESPFLTAPKTFVLSKSASKQNVFNFDMDDEDILQKSQSMAQLRKPKAKTTNKKLQSMKLTKLLDSLRKQIFKFQTERQGLFDSLAQNNAKIQKYIQKIETAINLRKLQIQKHTQELFKLKQEMM